MFISAHHVSGARCARDEWDGGLRQRMGANSIWWPRPAWVSTHSFSGASALIHAEPRGAGNSGCEFGRAGAGHCATGVDLSRCIDEIGSRAVKPSGSDPAACMASSVCAGLSVPGSGTARGRAGRPARDGGREIRRNHQGLMPKKHPTRRIRPPRCHSAVAVCYLPHHTLLTAAKSETRSRSLFYTQPQSPGFRYYAPTGAAGRHSSLPVPCGMPAQGELYQTRPAYIQETVFPKMPGEEDGCFARTRRNRR